MRLKLLACDVFLREVCYYVARSPHTIDVDFTALGSHADSTSLRRTLQDKIDALEHCVVSYDAVLLCYGLCGNALAGVAARGTQLVIPRAHDCCTILLGSRAAFRRHFGLNPSMPFSSVGYMERSESRRREEDVVSCDGKLYCFAECAAVYGEENARDIFEKLRSTSARNDTELPFIEMPQFRGSWHRDMLERKARAEKKEVVVLKGSGRLVRNLVYGRWSERDFCIVGPGQHTEGVYDWEEIVRAVRDG
jgi:hypothetical protein